MKAIPTIYEGRQYRSRLEAKWAAFFRLAGWEVEYEPYDLDGWIPDFIIRGNKHDGWENYPNEQHRDHILVEVKPVIEFPGVVAERLQPLCPDNAEILICGCGLLDRGYGLGWLWDGERWCKAPLGHWEKGNGVIGFCHESGSFHDRISGGYDGGTYGGLSRNTRMLKDPVTVWNSASNAVQWKAPQGGRDNSKHDFGATRRCRRHGFNYGNF